MNTKPMRIYGVLGVLCLVFVLAGCSAAGSPAAGTGEPQPTDSAEEIPAVLSSNSVMAEGKVVPAEDAALSFQTSGVVEEVLVAEGDRVEAGQPLIRLGGIEKLQATVSAAELERLSAQQAVKTLKDTANVARSNAQLALAEAQQALDKTKDRTESKEYLRGDQEQIDTARANYVIAEDGVKEATKQYDRVDDRDEDDPVRAEYFSQLAAARQKRDTALYNLNYLLGKPDELDVAEIDAEYAVAQANVAEAQRKLDLMKDGPDAEQLALAEARLQNAEIALAAAQANLDDLVLTAPFGGTISSIGVTEGEFVTVGVAVVNMADFSSWNVETTDLTELNVSRIRMGQPAMVRFDALPGVDIIGRVTNIKPFGENRQGDIVYTVVLQLEVPDESLRWNMTASVTFLEKETTE